MQIETLRMGNHDHYRETVMALESIERGTLEKLIDHTVESIPSCLKEIRGAKKELQIKDEEDYVLGFVWGNIYTDFKNYFINTKGRIFNDEELTEFVTVLKKRTREMKYVIFCSG